MMDAIGKGKLIHHKIVDALQNIEVSDDLLTKISQWNRRRVIGNKKKSQLNRTTIISPTEHD